MAALPQTSMKPRSHCPDMLPVINESKRMVGILSLGDVSHSAPSDLLTECVKSVSAHHH